MLTLFIIDCFCLQHILLSHSPDDPHFAGDLERHFINTLVWVCGGFLSSANKTSFNEWWRATFNLHSPQYRYPEGGTLWDYHVKPGTHGFLSWAKQVPPFSLPSDGATPPFVHTARSVALADFVMQCLANGCPVLLNGLSGSGKTSLLKQLVCESSKPALPDTNLLHVYCNLLTSAEVVWNQILDCVEWDWGRKYKPKGCKRLLCFIDDLHNTEVCTIISEFANNG